MFLSHTSELRRYPERGRSYVDQAERAVIKAEHLVIDMEDFPARDQTPVAFDEERVRQADVYVGIYGSRYGSPVRQRPGKSHTELEFEAATAAGIHRLIFIMDFDSKVLELPAKALIDPDHGAKQEAFLRRVEQERDLLVKRYRSPDDLGGKIYHALQALAAAEGPLGLAASEPSASEVPELLSYTPDRHAQEMRLAEAQRRFSATETTRPLVVILHGEEDQGVEMFAKRFPPDTPRAQLARLAEARTSHSLAWPRHLQPHPGSESHFRQWIVSGVTKDLAREDGQGRLLDDLDRPVDLGPMVLKTSVYSHEWGRHDDHLLARLCRFWQESDVLAGCCRIFWITIHYSKPAAYHPAIPWLRWLERRYWEQRLERWQVRRRNRRIRAALRRLEQAHAGDHSPVVLPELTSVCQSDAETWADSEEVKTYLNSQSQSPLKDEVRRFYRKQAQERRQRDIPMEELSAFLQSRLPLAREGRR